MSEMSKKIGLIKGNLSYAELADKIYEKTGYKIHYTTLQKYATGKREPSKKVLRVLSAYTGKPVSWFLEDEDQEISGNFLVKENEEIPYEYQEVFKKAKDKKIPPSSLKLFIEAVEKARKEKT
ncbi:helix-turn-helix domain-containing protein [Thermosediminibacter oceani]|uniref:Helix-turn-helix domain protein n=1 Tax=Thermosediminibacter oceani (strain ATCC BAA-1034 / DSM 16646 / JW/IW-1228P) TaxID=555079 RepID=D9S1Q9_THEOJ|nr:helix-turn-helix domain-containing protein [Thermosediminibacter oceani]ADL07336.1 helix-turn-helix domain protein [Thermosediminibacter oceani DSM 16646]